MGVVGESQPAVAEAHGKLEALEASAPSGSRTPFQVGAVSWRPLVEMGRDQWLLTGRRIGAMSRASSWWVGDWLRYGASRWGEKYTEAARVTGYDVHTLRNMAYVASKFDLSLRRDKLSWSHHAVLAALGPEEQAFWLDRAEEEKFSVADLKVELRSSQRHTKSVSLRWAENTCPNCGYLIKKGASKG